MKKIILSTFALIGFAISSNAQASATATATATIVTPITISKTTDMNFGNIAVATTSGTVVLDPAGTRTYTGGVTLPATTGTVTAAAFSVSGQTNYTYAITLPSTALTLTSGANTMSVGTFTSNPSSTGTLSSANPGVETINVGATLTVGASQPSGTYVSGTPFTVTVNYN